MSSNADWWSRRMAGQKPQQQSTPPLPPTPIAAPAVQQNYYQQQPQQPQQPQAPVSGCPHCGSSNWHRATQTTAPRCFDCGHMEGHDLGLSAMSAVRGEGGAPKRTTQVDSGGYNPSEIVGRIG
jgi:hypothetical protein